MRRFVQLLLVVTASLALLGTLSPASAQFGALKDKITKKVADKVDKKVDDKIDKTVDGKGKASDKAAAGKSEDEPAAGPAGPKGGTATAEDMTPFTRYDFVPGDKVIFYDDLAREEVGEFPSRWSLQNGVFEIADMAGQKWILCTNRGTIYPKIPVGPLPDKYTVELEIYSNADKDGWYKLNWLDAHDDKVGELVVSYSEGTELSVMDKQLANKRVERLAKGKHVLRVMATKSTIKCYLDQERIANVPRTEGFAPVKFTVYVDPYFEDNGHALIGSFRYAAGGKTMREQLDETGRIVTHGILFDSGSDRIKAESYKTLTDIGGLLMGDPALRLSIEGHTDSDGSDAGNLTLSQKRAAAVKAYLGDTYKVDAARLETKGWGEGKPIDSNTTPEGKANNRRVELVKL
jgi:OmpA-OmpF porin, OOP family